MCDVGILTNRKGLTVAALALSLSLSPALVAGSWGLVDPTRPPAVHVVSGEQAEPEPPPPPPETSWILQSIMISPGRSVAMVNGQVLGVGQFLDTAELVRILPNEVTFRLQGREIVLKLSTGGFMTPSQGTEDGKRTK